MDPVIYHRYYISKDTQVRDVYPFALLESFPLEEAREGASTDTNVEYRVDEKRTNSGKILFGVTQCNLPDGFLDTTSSLFMKTRETATVLCDERNRHNFFFLPVAPHSVKEEVLHSGNEIDYTLWVTLPAALLLGLSGGLVRACQGAYKDTPWEPFERIKFVRSLFIGMIGGVFWYMFLWYLFVTTDQVPSVHPAHFLALVVMFDSLVTETYKRGFRVENLAKYKMPTVFHLNGHLIHNRAFRASVSLLLLLFLMMVYAVFQAVGYATHFLAGSWFVGLLVGLTAGAIAASGGRCWTVHGKDSALKNFLVVLSLEDTGE